MSLAGAPWDYIAKLVCIGDSGCGKSSLTIRLCEGRFSPHHDVTIGVEFGSRIVPVGPPHSRSLTYSNRADLLNLPDSTDPASSSKPTPAPPAPKSKAQPSGKGGKGGEDPADDQKFMKLSLWDTAGQETYKSVTRSYFRGASGALLVFDLSRRDTFAHATDWLSDLRQIAEQDIVVILVGNKADLTGDPGVSDPDQDPGSLPPARTGQDDKREVTRAEAEDWARKNGVLEYVETSAKSGVNVEEAFMRVADRIFYNIQAGKYDLDDRRSGVKRQTQGVGGQGGRVRLNETKVSGRCC